MKLFPSNIIQPPESSAEIILLAEKTLKKAEAFGKLPTPIDDLIEASKIKGGTDYENALEHLLHTLNEKARSFLLSGIQKIRGLADLRDRAIYVPPDKPPRELFAKCHELGHEIIPWHNIESGVKVDIYVDDDTSLSHDTERLFDLEANFFAAEVIFQGQRFVERTRSFKPSFEAVFSLADLHGASKQATLRRYVESHDELVANITYMPSHYLIGQNGLPIFQKPWVFPSPKFMSKYPKIQLPNPLPEDHPWLESLIHQGIAEGEISLFCGHEKVSFQYQSWWNNYRLLILIRRKPLITRVRERWF